MKKAPNFIFTTPVDKSKILLDMSYYLVLQDDCVESSLNMKITHPNKNADILIYDGNKIYSIFSEASELHNQYRKYTIIKDFDSDFYLLYNSNILINKSCPDSKYNYSCDVIIKYDLKIKIVEISDVIRMIDQKYLDNLFEYCLNQLYLE